MQEPVIIQNIRKTFGRTVAVKDISLSVGKGEIFGLIGPDGAGKTTLLRMVVSLLLPDSGTIYFKGKSVFENPAFVRSQVGYMPQRFSLYPDLTVEENMRFFGDLFDISRKRQDERMEYLYRFSGLKPFRRRRANDLSGGMKQKLALTCTLMHEPDIIVMDEPTYGVDPVSRSDLWTILKTLAGEGKTVLVSTAYMDEARQCHRIGLMFNGEMLISGRPNRLPDLIKEPLYKIRTDRALEVYRVLSAHFSEDHCNVFGDAVHVFDGQNLGIAAIRALLQKAGLPFGTIERIRPGIEDVFLKQIKTQQGRKEKA